MAPRLYDELANVGLQCETDGGDSSGAAGSSKLTSESFVVLKASIVRYNTAISNAMLMVAMCKAMFKLMRDEALLSNELVAQYSDTLHTSTNIQHRDSSVVGRVYESVVFLHKKIGAAYIQHTSDLATLTSQYECKSVLCVIRYYLSHISHNVSLEHISKII